MSVASPSPICLNGCYFVISKDNKMLITKKANCISDSILLQLLSVFNAVLKCIIEMTTSFLFLVDADVINASSHFKLPIKTKFQIKQIMHLISLK